MHWSLKPIAAGATLASLAACTVERDVAAVPVVVQQPVPAPVVTQEYYERQVTEDISPDIPKDADYYYHRRYERTVQ